MGNAEDPRGYLTAALGDDGALPAPPAATRRRIVVVRDDCHDTVPKGSGAVEVAAGAGARTVERASSPVPQGGAANSSTLAFDPGASGAPRSGPASGSGSSALLVALREFEAALTDPFQPTGGGDGNTDIDNNDDEIDTDIEPDKNTNIETDVLESMMRYEHWHGSGRGVQLEVQFQGEAGTGTGPTAEFLSIVSREFVASPVPLWRSNNGGGGGGGDSGDSRATALFPASLPVLHAVDDDAVEGSRAKGEAAQVGTGAEESRAAWVSHGCKLFGMLGWLVMQAVQVRF